jgi:hypothetical protein
LTIVLRAAFDFFFMDTLDKLSAFSVAAFILACLSPFAGPAAFVPAIVCGHLALRQRKTEPSLHGYGFGFAGLLVGYTVGAVYLAVYAGIFSLILNNVGRVAAVSTPSAHQPHSLTDWLPEHPGSTLIGVIAAFTVGLIGVDRLFAALRRARRD